MTNFQKSVAPDDGLPIAGIFNRSIRKNILILSGKFDYKIPKVHSNTKSSKFLNFIRWTQREIKRLALSGPGIPLKC